MGSQQILAIKLFFIWYQLNVKEEIFWRRERELAEFKNRYVYLIQHIWVYRLNREYFFIFEM